MCFQIFSLADRVLTVDQPYETTMTSIKLSAEETRNRFGVAIPIENFPNEITSLEMKNVQTVLKYMEVWVSWVSIRHKYVIYLLSCPADCLFPNRKQGHRIRQASLCSK